MSYRDKIWLWGQTAGGHHKSGYALPGENKMSAEEGLKFFGIDNLCKVKLSFEEELSYLDEENFGGDAKKICVSLLGAGGKSLGDDTDDIIALAKKDERVIAGVMDDFVSEERLKKFPPEKLREIRQRLHTAAGRKIEMWSVLYEVDLEKPIKECAREFDLTTFWTWRAENIANLEEDYKKIRDITDGGRLMLSAYLFDYGNQKLMDDTLLQKQLDFIYGKLADNEIEGMLICSNCSADLGLSSVDVVKNWLNTI